MNKRKYWAASTDYSELSRSILAKVNDYDNFLSETNTISKLQEVNDHYYGMKLGGLRIDKSGGQGEITNISVNAFRNFITHVHVLTTQNKLAFEAQAINSDYEAQGQCLLAKAVLEYENSDKGLNKLLLDLVEGTLLNAEHYVSVRWNKFGGEPVAADLEANQAVMSGEVEYKLHSLIDVIRDSTRRTNRGQKWVILRESVNRFELEAQYPDFEDEILGAPEPQKKFSSLERITMGETDDIEVLTLYHDQSAALPKGRQVVMVGDTVIADDALPYRKIPVIRMAASDIQDSILAYSMSFDLCPLQKAQDALFTAGLSNNLAFALQNIWCKTDFGGVKDLGDGLGLIVSPEKPEAIQLTASSPELYKLIDLLQNQSQLLTGVNSVTRGQPDANLKSGAALALVAAQAISYQSNLQNAYADVVGQVGTAIVEILQKFATAPQIISMGGKAKRSYVKAFSKDDLSLIRKVVVKLGNALQQTVAGRTALAEQLMQAGLIKNAQQYLAVVETGTLDPLDEVEISELMSARNENEDIMGGKEVFATLVDDHIAHIMAHRAVAADTETRRNPEVMERLLDHIAEHIALIPQMPPELAQAMGIMQQPPMPPAPGPQQGMPQDPSMPAQMPSMPNMPQGTPPELQVAGETIEPPPGVNP
jgi:hypothetical protein